MPWRNVGDTDVIAPYERLRKEDDVRAAGRGRFLLAAISRLPFSGARITSESRLAAMMLGELFASAKLPKLFESSSVVDWRLDPGYDGMVRPGDGKAVNASC